MSEAIAVHHGEFGRACVYSLNKPILTHAHREAHIIFKVDGQDALVTVDGKQHQITKQTAVTVSPWQPHSFELEDDLEDCVTLVLYIKPMWFLENSQSAEHALSFGRNDLSLDENMIARVSKLASFLLQQDNYDQCDDLLYEVMDLCFKQSWERRDQQSFLELSRRRYADFRVRRSLRLMQENLTDDLNIEWLARECGLSRPHFFKLFKKQMGITPNLYMNTLRAERAIDELMTTDKTVTDIGNDLGFSSQASFTRFFTSNVGIPPSDYRRVAHVN